MNPEFKPPFRQGKRNKKAIINKDGIHIGNMFEENDAQVVVNLLNMFFNDGFHRDTLALSSYNPCSSPLKLNQDGK